MSAIRKLIVWLESPKARQAWRFARIAGAFIAASGIVDQITQGTATVVGVAAVLAGALEVAYRAKVKA